MQNEICFVAGRLPFFMIGAIPVQIECQIMEIMNFMDKTPPIYRGLWLSMHHIYGVDEFGRNS